MQELGCRWLKWSKPYACGPDLSMFSMIRLCQWFSLWIYHNQTLIDNLLQVHSTFFSITYFSHHECCNWMLNFIVPVFRVWLLLLLKTTNLLDPLILLHFLWQWSCYKLTIKKCSSVGLIDALDKRTKSHITNLIIISILK